MTRVLEALSSWGGVKRDIVFLAFSGIALAVRAAREAGARLLCFGHTHEALCEFENGLWIVNPGAAGSIARPTYAVAVLEGDGAVCYLSNI